MSKRTNGAHKAVVIRTTRAHIVAGVIKVNKRGQSKTREERRRRETVNRRRRNGTVSERRDSAGRAARAGVKAGAAALLANTVLLL